MTKHKLTVGLLALEVTLTCALVCNVVFLIVGDIQRIGLDSGLDEHALVMISSISPATEKNLLERHREDLSALRSIAGVQSAVAVNTLPFARDETNTTIWPSLESDYKLDPSIFIGTPGELKTLGLHLVAGRRFRRNEYIPMQSAKGNAGISAATAAIVTKQFAKRIFHGKTALGKLIYPGQHGMRIVGIVDRMMRPTLHGSGRNSLSVILPLLPDSRQVTYVMRTRPSQRNKVLSSAKEALSSLDPRRELSHDRTYDQMRYRFFGHSRSTLGMLVVSCIGLLFVTALGIVGLASFWVQRRRRQIGVRRALGARKVDILYYFQLENAIVISAGVVPGVILAIMLNVLLMQYFAVDRLPLWYAAVGAVIFWILGQLAVFVPALRAAHVPPVEATRSV
jgi:putative ABC transport system permease protein